MQSAIRTRTGRNRQRRQDVAKAVFRARSGGAESQGKKTAGYQETIKDRPPETIVCMDECGMGTCLYREYGYAPRGRQVFGQLSGRKYKRCNLAAAKTAGKIPAPLQYSGPMDSRLFEAWFSGQLLPAPDEDAVIVMDNASFHSGKRFIPVAQNTGYRLLFLPAGSPELNPIGHFGPR